MRETEERERSCWRIMGEENETSNEVDSHVGIPSACKNRINHFTVIISNNFMAHVLLVTCNPYT
jgi:hypothetical protein